MKKLIFTHIFINLYILALLQPVLPLLDYVVNYDYIVSELCVNKSNTVKGCNGKCYLSAKVEKQTKDDVDKPIPKLPKLDLNTFLIFVIFNPLDWHSSVNSEIEKKVYYWKEQINSFYIGSVFHPPQF